MDAATAERNRKRIVELLEDKIAMTAALKRIREMATNIGGYAEEGDGFNCILDTVAEIQSLCDARYDYEEGAI